MFDLRNRQVCHNGLYDIYFSRKQRAKCGPAADRLSCRISTKMDSQPCGGTIPNKPPQCVYSQLSSEIPTMYRLFTPVIIPFQVEIKDTRSQAS